MKTKVPAFDKARLLIDHPHSHREWEIIAKTDVPGFYHLLSRFQANPGESLPYDTKFILCLHETEFERLA